jgi:hypothetical protein
MLGNEHFYNRSIRKVVVAFGTIFNEIDVVRFTKDGITPKERFKVPLSYGAKENYITRLSSDPTATKSIRASVPRMSFNLDSIAYDASRKQLSTLQNFSVSGNNLYSQYVPIPYNYEMSLSIYVRNTEDGTQILEQILPFFTPDFTITVDFIPELGFKYDIPIILNTVDSEITYEGEAAETRLIIWNLTFTIKSFMWPPLKNLGDLANNLIRQANTNIYNIDTNNKDVSITVVPDPIDAEPYDNYGFTTTIIEYDGVDSANT